MRIGVLHPISLAGFFLLLLWLPAMGSAGEVRQGEISRWEIYQWRDSRGVIHFTDNLRSVPASVRDTPNLIVRRDLTTREAVSPVASTRPYVTGQEPEPRFRAKEAAAPRTPLPKAVPRVVYQPQTYTTIVVVNSFVPVKKGIARSRRSSGPARPRDFNDRRFIHPSAFGSTPGPHIRPGPARSRQR